MHWRKHCRLRRALARTGTARHPPNSCKQWTCSHPRTRRAGVVKAEDECSPHRQPCGSHEGSPLLCPEQLSLTETKTVDRWLP